MAKGANVYLLYREGGSGICFGVEDDPSGGNWIHSVVRRRISSVQSVLIKYSASLVAPKSHLDGGVGEAPRCLWDH